MLAHDLLTCAACLLCAGTVQASVFAAPGVLAPVSAVLKRIILAVQPSTAASAATSAATAPSHAAAFTATAATSTSQAVAYAMPDSTAATATASPCGAPQGRQGQEEASSSAHGQGQGQAQGQGQGSPEGQKRPLMFRLEPLLEHADAACAAVSVVRCLLLRCASGVAPPPPSTAASSTAATSHTLTRVQPLQTLSPKLLEAAQQVYTHAVSPLALALPQQAVLQQEFASRDAVECLAVERLGEVLQRTQQLFAALG